MIGTSLHPHVVFAGGGTGGHLFPGLAVAQRLANDVPGMRITFAGTGRDFERHHVASAGFGYVALPCRPLPKRLRDVVPFVLAYVAGQRAAVRFLHCETVGMVVGLGGYASVPLARAAGRVGLPLVLLEQNAVPGRATRWLARSATLICTTFHQAHPYLDPRSCYRVTGNPIRAGFRSLAYDCNPWHGHARSTRQLLVLGGSGGARTLNECVPRALDRLRSLLAGWKIVHQSGESHFESTRQRYGKLGLWAEVVPFLADMPEALCRTDLVICRAGGTTLAELAAAGVPAILLPYPRATDDHQRKNADVFAAAGGSLVLDEREFHGRLDDQLAETLSPLLANATRLHAMSAANRRLARPDAAWDVATIIRQLAR